MPRGPQLEECGWANSPHHSQCRSVQIPPGTPQTPPVLHGCPASQCTRFKQFCHAVIKPYCSAFNTLFSNIVCWQSLLWYSGLPDFKYFWCEGFRLRYDFGGCSKLEERIHMHSAGVQTPLFSFQPLTLQHHLLTNPLYQIPVCQISDTSDVKRSGAM